MAKSTTPCIHCDALKLLIRHMALSPEHSITKQAEQIGMAFGNLLIQMDKSDAYKTADEIAVQFLSGVIAGAKLDINTYVDFFGS